MFILGRFWEYSRHIVWLTSPSKEIRVLMQGTQWTFAGNCSFRVVLNLWGDSGSRYIIWLIALHMKSGGSSRVLKKIQLQTNNWPTGRLKVLRHGFFIKKAAVCLFSYAEAIFNHVVFTTFLHICMSQPQSSYTGNA